MRFFLAVVTMSLAGVSTAQEQLAKDCVAILSREETNVLDQDHSVCPDAKGKVSFLEGHDAEINGIPNAEMADLFRDGDLYGACRDVFADAPFGPAVEAIARTRGIEDVQEAMASVFDSIDWQWHPYEPAALENGARVYACVELSPLAAGGRATVHLYRSMCRASRIYDVNIGPLNLGTRFWTVAAHEVGHVIDELSGCSAAFSGDPEIRATVYGLAISECHARRWQALFAMLAEEPASNDPNQPEHVRQSTLSCLRAKWEVMERRAAALRASLLTSAADRTSPLAAVSACASAAGDGRAVAVLDRCPSAPEVR